MSWFIVCFTISWLEQVKDWCFTRKRMLPASIYMYLTQWFHDAGSEAESDENEDLDEDEDVLEMMEGDQDDVLPEHELRDQVGRVHLWVMWPMWG